MKFMLQFINVIFIYIWLLDRNNNNNKKKSFILFVSLLLLFIYSY